EPGTARGLARGDASGLATVRVRYRRGHSQGSTGGQSQAAGLSRYEHGGAFTPPCPSSPKRPYETNRHCPAVPLVKSYPSGRRITTPSGGTVRDTDSGCPCCSTCSARIPPPLPLLEPP